jgi:multiple sugar transport system substrate-binding protein
MPYPSRRIAAAIILATAAGSLAACAAPASSDQGSAPDACEPSKGKVTLDYWSWIPGIAPIVDAFNKSHPDIQVKVNEIVGAGAYQDYYNALKAGKAPDLGMIEYDRIPEFRAGNHLLDISDCKPIKGLKDRIVPFTYNQVTLGTDSVYATPTDLGTLGLYYRKDLFEKYGLSTPATWDDYLADAQKLKAADPAVKITSFTPQDVSTLHGLVWQAGAHPYSYTDDSFVLDMGSAEMTKVGDYWQKMIDDGLVDTSAPPFSPALYAAWNSGSIASYIGPSWIGFVLQPNAADTAGKWGVLPLPAWSASKPGGGNWGGGATSVFAGSKHPYEAAVFANWLSNDPEANKILFATGGQSASSAWANSGINDTPVDFYGGQPVFQVFQASAEETDPTFQWAPDQTNVNSYLQDALAGAFDGSSTISDAFRATQKKAVADLKSQSIPVVEK